MTPEIRRELQTIANQLETASDASHVIADMRGDFEEALSVFDEKTRRNAERAMREVHELWGQLAHKQRRAAAALQTLVDNPTP